MFRKRKMKHLFQSDSILVPRQTAYYRRKRGVHDSQMAESEEKKTSTQVPNHEVLSSNLPEAEVIQEEVPSTSLNPACTFQPVPQQYHQQSSTDNSDVENTFIFDSATSDDTLCIYERRKIMKRKRRSKRTSNKDVELPLSASDSSSDLEFTSSAESSSTEPEDSLSNKERQEESSNDRNEVVLGDTKEDTLCQCTDITAGDVMYMVLSLGLRHSLSWDAQVDILKLVGTIVGDHKVPTTKYLYLKQFQHDASSITSHIFCHKCEQYLGVKESFLDLKNCTFCGASVNVKSISNFFISLSIADQFRTLLKDELFLDKVLNYRFERQQEDRVYNDILDGAVYRKLFENNGILASKYNFSYAFFTDGMAFGNTSNRTIWPIYLTVNELPYEYRSKFLILAGLYVGPKDPDLQCFLKPFVDEANTLSNEGFTWIHENDSITSYAIPLCCIADSVARCKILNFQSFGATFGCTFCYHKSEHTRIGQRFLVKPQAADLRSRESTMQDLHEVYLRRNLSDPRARVYRGVRGLTPLMSLNFFDMNSHFVVDYMHALTLGVVKHHVFLVHESRFKKVWIGCEGVEMGIEHITEAVDARINSMQSNSSIFRVLRPISVYKQWRASEFKAWVLYYALPCLRGLMKEKYLHHFSLLSKATHLLLQKSITLEEVEEVHRLFLLYAFFMEKYFGEENMRYNVHLLSHIANGVKNFGPVWSHNSFLYEAQNRYIKQMAKNPSLVILEIARKFLIYKNLPFLCDKMVSSEKAVSFSDNVLQYKRVKKFVRYNSGCTLLGTGVPIKSNFENEAIIKSAIPHFNYTDHKSYQRMVLKGRLFSTEEYSKGKQNNDSYAKTVQGSFVLIKDILYCGASGVYLITEKLNVSRRPYLRNELTRVDHIKEIRRSGHIQCIPYSDIKEPCMFISVPHGQYLSPIPYGSSVE